VPAFIFFFVGIFCTDRKRGLIAYRLSLLLQAALLAHFRPLVSKTHERAYHKQVAPHTLPLSYSISLYLTLQVRVLLGSLGSYPQFKARVVSGDIAPEALATLAEEDTLPPELKVSQRLSPHASRLTPHASRLA
jgi:hypothetical protein